MMWWCGSKTEWMLAWKCLYFTSINLQGFFFPTGYRVSVFQDERAMKMGGGMVAQY